MPPPRTNGASRSAPPERCRPGRGSCSLNLVVCIQVSSALSIFVSLFLYSFLTVPSRFLSTTRFSSKTRVEIINIMFRALSLRRSGAKISIREREQTFVVKSAKSAKCRVFWYLAGNTPACKKNPRERWEGGRIQKSRPKSHKKPASLPLRDCSKSTPGCSNMS